MGAFYRHAGSVWPASLILARRIVCPLVFLGAGLMVVQLCAGTPFQFEPTGPLVIERAEHTATLLPNGTVLVAGGHDGFGNLAAAELYDPVTGIWRTTAYLNHQHYEHTATLLRNGKVLVVGGYDGEFLRTYAELFDPVSETWTDTGSLATKRGEHTATLLRNGKVLVAGGYNDNFVPLRSAELYDPVSGTWTTTGSLQNARVNHTATLLTLRSSKRDMDNHRLARKPEWGYGHVAAKWHGASRRRRHRGTL